MTLHRWATVTLLAVLSILIVLDFSYALPWWGYAIPFLIYGTMATVGSAWVSSGYHMKTLCHGSRREKKVGLSFDDGPHPEVTPQVLEILNERGIKAAFFLIGEQVIAYPELVERIYREGHLIGNHSWSHAFIFDLFPSKRMAIELTRTSEHIASLTGYYPLAFRPPYGVTNPMLRKAVERVGLVPIGWDVRSFDTSKNEKRSLKRVLGRIRSGSLILLHDTDQKMVRILPRLLDGMEEKGYECVRPDRLLQKDLQHEVSSV